jgi:L-seryl-tRNA(Ser) seleniumtransferase
VRSWCETHGRGEVMAALRAAVDQTRVRIAHNGDDATDSDAQAVIGLAGRILARQTLPSLRPVINATGVVLHTGLGRSPLGQQAIDAIVSGASGYCNLELDLETGRRGRRANHVEQILTRLTGAEAATVVNNNAAALVLIMRALCEDREVIVSRGELVEIGGSFRMPDIMASGGARLREVGTTNRTRIGDFASAITENTAALLRVHCSNFQVVGFTAQPSPKEIADCAHAHHLIAIDDIGSGAMFDFSRLGLSDEPDVLASLRAGMDLVCFSGDKLLGGPQSGIIVGSRELIERIETHPLMRTYRVDKLALLALEGTLRQYVDTDVAVDRVPTLAMLGASETTLVRRAKKLVKALLVALPDEAFSIAADMSYAGGGSMPGEGIDTTVVRWRPSFDSVDAVAERLRRGSPAVVVRIQADDIVLDVRTIRDADLKPLARAIAESAQVS